jgi:hypothetical protein
MSNAIPVERGCGTRQKSGVYFECGVSGDGLPLENFLVDAPKPADRKKLGIAPRGVKLLPFEEGGEVVFHIVDWVGCENYPNVWDFLGEAQRFGISRRIPKNLDFSKVSNRTKILCLHSRAIVANSERYSGRSIEAFGNYPLNADRIEGQKNGGWICPKGFLSHNPIQKPEPCCAGIWAQDVEGGEPYSRSGVIAAIDGAEYPGDDSRLIRRTMPSFAYIARRAPDNVEPVYQLGLFAIFPLSRLAVVSGPESGEIIKKVSRANKVRVEEVNE